MLNFFHNGTHAEIAFTVYFLGVIQIIADIEIDCLHSMSYNHLLINHFRPEALAPAINQIIIHGINL